jgi:hypothetical protein
VRSEPFADHALHPVAGDGVTNAPRNDEAKSRRVVVRIELERKVLTSDAARTPSNARVVARRANSVRAPKRLRPARSASGFVDHNELRRALGALLRADRRYETLTALGAAALQDNLPAFRAHARSKAMRTLSSNSTRLKCALHARFLIRRSGGESRKERGKLPTRGEACQCQCEAIEIQAQRSNAGDRVADRVGSRFSDGNCSPRQSSKR